MDPTPFTSPDADVVLRATDGTSFKVYSRILVEASIFFRDLLQLPQPAAEKNASTAVIDIPEDSEALHKLLMFTYPIEDPSIESLKLLGDVLGMALKYDMVLATQTLRRLLVSHDFVNNEPIRVYAIACRYLLVEEGKLASKYTLTFNVLDAPLAEELKFATASDYHLLLKLHRTRTKAAQKLLVYNQRFQCVQCQNGSGVYHSGSRWWTDWSTRANEELQRGPTSDVIFSLPFLAKSTMEGCLRCGESLLRSYDVLLTLKKSIDDLPDTI